MAIKVQRSPTGLKWKKSGGSGHCKQFNNKHMINDNNNNDIKIIIKIVTRPSALGMLGTFNPYFCG